jgi:2-polyprenyl-3-methyl-5-hydroxy-6-metoxy-1,4-benzoquinol methylase
MISELQKSQENEYCFPYHYISRRFRSGFSQHFVDTWGINYISTIELIIDRIKLEASECIVDIGCGDGRLTREIALEFTDKHVVGIDYSDRAIQLARVMNSDLAKVEFQSIDINTEKLDLKFDVAILMEVYEHIPLEVSQAFLRNVCAIIKPGGKLLMTVPHSNKPVEYKHFQHFTVDAIKNQLSREFEVIEAIPFEKKGWGRKLLNYLLCNRFYVLNNKKLLNVLYKMHKKYLVSCKTEVDCQRILIVAKPKLKK